MVKGQTGSTSLNVRASVDKGVSESVCVHDMNNVFSSSSRNDGVLDKVELL